MRLKKKKEKKRESEDNTPVVTPVRKWKAGYSKTLVHTSRIIKSMTRLHEI